jgi:hypothetical protein
MRFLLALALLLTFSIPTPSQTKAEPQIFQWSKDDPRCDRIYSEGDTYLIFNNGGVKVAATMGFYGDYYTLQLFVFNGTEKRIDVLTSEAHVLIWKNQGDKNYEFLSAIPPEKIAEKFQNKAKWRASLRTLSAALANTSTTTTSSGTVSVYGNGQTAQGVYSGSSTTTAPNQELQRRVAEKNEQARSGAASKGEAVLRVALQSTTLFPKQDASGMIFFPKKKGYAGMAGIEIDGVRYLFSFNSSGR